MTINWEFKHLDSRELHGTQAYDTEQDFPSISEAKKHLNQMFKNYACLTCGGRKINGYGIVVEICKIKMFKQRHKKGLFGKVKYIDEHLKTIWRIHDIYAKAGGFFGGAGYMECKSCGSKVKSENAFWGQWAKNIAEARKRGDI